MKFVFYFILDLNLLKMETFEVICRGTKVNIVIMKNGIRLCFENHLTFICYSTIRNIHKYNDGHIQIRLFGDNWYEILPTDNNNKTSEKIMPVLTKYMENFYNESDKTQQIMDELAEIKQQLSALFYAPGFSGSLQAKASFEEKSKN